MNNRFIFCSGDRGLTVTAYSDRVLRLTWGERTDKSLIVTGSPRQTDCRTEETASEYRVRSGGIEAVIDKKTAAVGFLSGPDRLVDIEAPSFTPYEVCRFNAGRRVEKKTVDGVKAVASDGESVFDRIAHHAELTFRFGDEILFGLGSHEEGWPCVNGQFVPMYQENMRIAVPVLVSSKGYAVLIDNTSWMTFDCRDGINGRLYIDCADCVDIYVIAGSFDDFCAEYRLLTGETPLPPKAALGYFQSKCEYKNQDELLSVVRRYRESRVPLDFIVQDWQYWLDGAWGDKNPDPARFPDMTACIDELHRMGAKIMISVWPNVGGDSANKREFTEKGCLLGNGSVYNAFDEKARVAYWSQAENGLFRHGIDAWWCDCSEPFEVGWSGETREPLDARMTKTVTEFKKYVDDSLLNVFSLFHSKGIYENQRACSGKRVFNMTSSGYAGQHRYGAAVWSGDINSSWTVLRRQVHIIQNYIATGEAYWNSDIGGYFHDSQSPWFWKGEYEAGTADEGYRELYARWMQFGGFTPIMRSHGMHLDKEIWNFGAPGEKYYDAIRSAIELRYKLMPFFYSVNAAVTFDGIMPVRPLALAYPGDERARGAFDEYIYGDSLLVCPVTEPGINSMKVILPRGVWYDIHTNEKYTGGGEYEVAVDISHIPVFAKAGAIIPTAPVMQYADEIPDAEYSVRIYAGADGQFMLYDDAGDGYGYEKGEYSRLRITYSDRDGKIGAEQTGVDRFSHPIRYEIIG